MKNIFLSVEDDSNLTVNCRSRGILQASQPLEGQLLDYCGDRISRYEANYIARDRKNKGRKDAKKNKK